MKEALKNQDAEKWKEAIDKEIKMLEGRQIWKVVPRPVSKMILPSKIVLKIKRNADISVVRFKKHLVALGNLQREDEYDQMVSHFVTFTTFRMAFVLAEHNQEHFIILT